LTKKIIGKALEEMEADDKSSRFFGVKKKVKEDQNKIK